MARNDLADDEDVWLAYMLYDQGYVSQEKAAELTPYNLELFRDFCRTVVERVGE